MIIFLANTAFGACTFSRADKSLVLENEFVRLTLQPDTGGKGSSLVFKKTGEELTSWPEYGILEDRFWIDRANNDFPKIPYSWKLLRESPEEIRLLLSCKGQGVGFSGLVLEKTVVISAGSSAVRVFLELRNEGKEEIPVGLWSFQHLLVKGRNNTYFRPGTSGVVSLDHRKKGAAWTGYWDNFLYDFARGWTGFVADSLAGAVCIVDPAVVSCFYNCGRATPEASTMEWIYSKFMIKPGESWKTTYAVIPFTGLARIDGAGGDAVGAIIPSGTPEPGKPLAADLLIVSATKKTVAVKPSVRKLATGETTPLPETSVDVGPAGPAKIPVSFTPSAAGTYVLRCVVAEKDQVLFDMETPLSAGKPGKEPYRLERNFQSVGQEMGEYRAMRSTVSRIDSYIHHRMVSDFQTPCQVWGKPYAGGSLKLLMTTIPGRGRELIELDQRMDLNYAFIIHCESSYEEEQWNSLLDANTYDVLFLEEGQGSPPLWAGLSAATRNKILAAVEKGAGLVYIGYDKWWADENDPLHALSVAARPITDELARELPLALIPALAGGGSVRITELGKGRVVFVDVKRGNTDYASVNNALGESELYYAFLSRVLLYAGKKEPAVRQACEVKTDPAGKPDSLLLTLSSPEALNGSLILTVRDRFGKPVLSQDKPFSIGKEPAKVSVKLPTLMHGIHMAELQVKNEAGKMVTWGAWPFRAASPIMLSGLSPVKEPIGKGEPVAASVVVENTLGASKKLSLEWDLTDTTGRLVCRNSRNVDVPPGKSTIPLETDPIYPLTRLHVLKARILEDRTILDETRGDVLTRPIEKAPFVFCAHKANLGRLRDLGFNAASSASPQSTAALNMDFLAWDGPNIWFVNFTNNDVSERIRNPCLTDPEFLKKVQEKWKGVPELYEKYGVLGHVANDETAYDGHIGACGKNNRSDLCHSPSCIAGFQEYLKTRYGSIENLNRAWATSYKGFPEIQPPLWQDIQKRIREVDRGSELKFADWLDHQFFKEAVLTDFHGFCLRTTGNRIKFGLTGMGDIASGYFIGWDWWQLFGKRNMTCVSMYAGLGGSPGVLEIIRSFSRPEDFITDWSYSYDMEDVCEKSISFGPWNLLFHGGDGINFYLDEWTPYSPMVFADWTLRNDALWLKPQADLINREGIGALIRNAVRSKAQVAVHYSQASLHANRLLGMMRGSVPTLSDDWISTITLVRELGLQADYVSYEQVEEGKLSEFRVLIMPFSHWVSAKEAAAIRQFVDKGGLVIADVRSPLIARMLNGAELDDLFGIKQEGFPSYRKASLTLPNGKTVEATLGCRKLSVTTGKALAKFTSEDVPETPPAVVVNSVGKGKAVYLNLSYADYQQLKMGGVGGEVTSVVHAKEDYKESIRNLLKDILEESGVRPDISVRAEDRNWLPEIVRYRNGEAEYVAVLHCDGPGRITQADRRNVTVSFGRKAHVYDVLQKTYCGNVSTISTVMTDGIPSLFALLPSKIDSVAVQMPSRHTAGRLLNMKVSVKGGSGGVVVLALSDPSGNERYRSLASAVGDVAEFSIPVALNELPGPWKAEAVDAASGIRGSTSFTLAAP